MKHINSVNRWSNGKRVSVLILTLILLLLTGCSSTRPSETGASEGSGPFEGTSLPGTTEPVSEKETSGSDSTEPVSEKEASGSGSTETAAPEGTDRMIYAYVNGKVLKILAAENSSADAFLDFLKTGDVTVEMHDYGGFEKVGPLGTDLPRNDEEITTEAGDVILYQGSQITIYYDVNSWSFTRLGKVQDLSQSDLKEILGGGNATVTFSLRGSRASGGEFDFEKQPAHSRVFKHELAGRNHFYRQSYGVAKWFL